MTPITIDFVKNNMPKRPDNAHKGSMGTLLNISGSYSMAGACVLSSLSALRSGVGLVKIALPKSIYPIVSSSVYEAVYLPLGDDTCSTVDVSSLEYLLSQATESAAVLLGCGLQNTAKTREFVSEFVLNNDKPILIDADGINALSMNIDILAQTKAPVVLTPHPKEMSRITGYSVEHICANRQQVAQDFAKKFSVTVVLKGHNTIVTDGVSTYVNNTGNSGMAKGGSGDVLSGIIASLMAQGVDVLTSACMGVYIHGLSGDMAAHSLSKTAMLPSDLINTLPQVFRSLE